MISEDWVVRYDNRYFQLQPQSRHYASARGQVLVCEGRHGQIDLEYRGRALPWREIAAPVPAAHNAPSASERRPMVPTRRGKWVPPADHPWREAARRGAQQKALRESAAARASLALPSAAP